MIGIGETDRPLEQPEVKALLEAIGPCLEGVDLVLVSDYAKGVVTRYAFDAANHLVTVDYPNDPDVTFTYNRLGRQQNIHDAVGERTFAYDPQTLELETETITGLTLDRGYPPTVREIASALGITPNAVMGHLRALEKKGLITCDVMTVSGMTIAEAV